MKVLFFSSHLLWPSHYETELDLIQQHIDAGDSVTQVYCNGQLPNCDLNPFFEPATCDVCLNTRKLGWKAITGNFERLSLPAITEAEKASIEAIPYQFTTLAEIQALEFDGFDIGYAVASSLISIIRDPRPDFMNYQTTIRDYLAGSAAMYLIALKLIQEKKPDVVYAFNGRLAHVKPILRAAQKMQVECRIHERGSSHNKYSICVNTTPHDRIYMQAQMRKAWEEATEPYRTEVASEFFQKKLKGAGVNWYSFTENQKDLLPPNWDSNRKNVVIFNSSEDEFASLGKEWKNTLYVNQLEGIRRIVHDLKSETNVHIYLRVHPNLKHVDNDDLRAVNALKEDNLTLISADSPISTYKLMLNASVVLTFGSSVGIEAPFWGIPSVLAGKSLYMGLGSTYEPQSHDEVIALLKSPLEPKEKIGSLLFGFFYNSQGLPFRHYKAEDFKSGTINGIRLSDAASVSGGLKSWLFKSSFMKPVAERLRARLKHQRVIQFRLRS
jgi:hypothetical protein